MGITVALFPQGCGQAGGDAGRLWTFVIHGCGFFTLSQIFTLGRFTVFRCGFVFRSGFVFGYFVFDCFILFRFRGFSWRGFHFRFGRRFRNYGFGDGFGCHGNFFRRVFRKHHFFGDGSRFQAYFQNGSFFRHGNFRHSNHFHWFRGGFHNLGDNLGLFSSQFGFRLFHRFIHQFQDFRFHFGTGFVHERVRFRRFRVGILGERFARQNVLGQRLTGQHREIIHHFA